MVSVCLGRTEKWYQELKAKQEQCLKLEVEVGLEREQLSKSGEAGILNPLEQEVKAAHPAPWCCAEVARRGTLNRLRGLRLRSPPSRPPRIVEGHRSRGIGVLRRLIGKVESLNPVLRLEPEPTKCPGILAVRCPPRRRE